MWGIASAFRRRCRASSIADQLCSKSAVRSSSPRGLLRRLLLLPAVATVLWALPAAAISALSAWRISSDGVLELRTPPATRVEAFFEEGQGAIGPRIWLDLPGAPQRTRSIRGSGAIREVRVGRPSDTTTRLVIEFRPGTRLDPRSIRLVGTQVDRWSMEFGPAVRGLTAIGEGSLEAPSTPSWRAVPPPSLGIPSGPIPNLAGLADVPAGRYKVVLDPGHGGPDPGAVGINGLRETDVVLDVSLQVAQILQAKGVQVLLTRTSEVDVDLPPRVALANNSGADLFLSIHANALSLSRPDVNGIETFYFQGGRSKAFAEAIQAQMLAVSPGSPDRGARSGRFFVIRRTVMPAALAEMGFVTGQLDSPRLADPGFRRRMAVAIAGGILNYLAAYP
ncbi:MAG: N-acetylmuramoyl-L-alanine amidase [Cyanobacteria bacterium M_surface_10_m1_298]|nr:N-acetylmuramoyl-L-alanine amidase [Cyanobacteria bacterium M_surface_10_m1_298]